MSKENPTIEEVAARPGARVETCLMMSSTFAALAASEAARLGLPGWESTFQATKEYIESSAADFKRWQEQQAKGGAM